MMRLLLVWIGRLSGTLGVLLSATAVLTRMSGSYHVGAFQAVTLLQAGVAAMVLGSLAYIASMADPSNR